jgi:flagellar biosynthesis protein FlhB
MAENKEGQDKSEPASAKRLQEARQKGQVAKSHDVTTASIILIGGATVFFLGKPIISNTMDFMKHTFTNMCKFEFTDVNIVNYYITILIFLAEFLLPVIGVLFLITLAAEISQVGFNFASKKFTEGLNFKTIFNPFSGIKKMLISSRSIFELLKSVVKLALLGFVVYQILNSRSEETISLVEMPFGEIGKFLADVTLELILKVGSVYIIIAATDFFYQKYKFKEDRKMTKNEVREEGKQTEGDPKIKARIRSLMRGRIRKLMLQNVKKADVVITNPTHFAVALAYYQGKMSAPIVLAKGADYLALQIRQIAIDSDIPIVEDPPIARALFYSVEIDREIPESLFKAVAQILAYVYNLKPKKKIL